MSCSPVDAGGVPAEWVEAAAATTGQRTLVCFVPDHGGSSAAERSRSASAMVASATGARVLTAYCKRGIDDGVTAYAWLLREGTDLARTSFISEPADISLACAILQAAVDRGLPAPTGGVRPVLRGGDPYPTKVSLGMPPGT